MIISRTPIRISFFGGGSDYEAWCKEHKGSTLSTTINRYCYIQVRHLPSFFAHRYRIVYSEKEDVDSLEEIKHPLVREVLRDMKLDNERIEIVHTSDIPSMSGLGTSSSFTVGLINSLYALKDKMIEKKKLALEAIRIEHNIEESGYQDQLAAAFGGFNKIDFVYRNNQQEFDVNPITINKYKLHKLESSLLLFYTGFTRKASDIAKEQIKNTPNKTNELKRMVEMVDESIDILNSNNKDFIYQFGILLDESWQIKRSLSDKITNSKIDEIYKKGIGAGAIGGKLIGAGGGGCLLFCVETENQNNIKQKMKELGLIEIEFKFSNERSKIIYYDP